MAKKKDSYKRSLPGELTKEIAHPAYMLNRIPKFRFTFPDSNPVSRY